MTRVIMFTALIVVVSGSTVRAQDCVVKDLLREHDPSLTTKWVRWQSGTQIWLDFKNAPSPDFLTDFDSAVSKWDAESSEYSFLTFGENVESELLYQTRPKNRDFGFGLLSGF